MKKYSYASEQLIEGIIDSTKTAVSNIASVPVNAVKSVKKTVRNRVLNNPHMFRTLGFLAGGPLGAFIGNTGYNVVHDKPYDDNYQSPPDVRKALTYDDKSYQVQ